MSNMHPALRPGGVAVITGAASGIGLAVAHNLAGAGMRVCLADCDEQALQAAGAAIPGALGVPTDVSDPASVEALARVVRDKLGPVSLLMNNAAGFDGADVLSNPEGWNRTLGINVLGVVYGVQAFVPDMIAAGQVGVVVNTGSKQGITNPPGNTAYNTSKAAVKALTEGLAHSLRNTPGCQVSAHLLIPGFTFTGRMMRAFPKKPDAAWEADQVADRLLEGLARDEFYILCQDNETTREMDDKRVLWAAGDITENRPALSRWHPDWKAEFDRFMAGPGPQS